MKNSNCLPSAPHQFTKLFNVPCLLKLKDVSPVSHRLPFARHSRRMIVLNLSTAFPACAWAFVKMM